MRRQRGFSMIEILVALVVLAIGLLGMAGLQAASLRATADGGNLGSAVRLAYDMSDRVRLEPTSAALFIADAATDKKATDTSGCYSGAGCNGPTRVTAGVAEWQRLLGAQLPGGDGIVCRDSTPYDGASSAAPACTGLAADPLVVKVWWRAADLTRQSADGTVVMRHVSVVGL